MKKRKKFISLAVLLAVAAMCLPGRASAGTLEAVAYLKNQIPDAWITQALIAADEIDAPTNHLISVAEGGFNPTNDYAKTILALAAAGKDPTAFGNIDYVAKLKTYYNNNQMGSDALLNDDIWSLLAFASIKKINSAEAQAAKNFLLSHQNTDGGWGYDLNGGSNTNDTAAAIMALIESGISANDALITKALAYLKFLQNTDGGFPYNPAWGGDSDSGSDAWVICALQKAGQDPISWTISDQDGNSHNPITNLQSLQDADGGFWWIAGTSEWNNKSMTAYALIALAGKSFPVGYYEIPKLTRLAANKSAFNLGESVTVAVEYFNDQDWLPLAGAEIKGLTQNYVTDGAGQISMTLPSGHYDLTAEKSGFVASNLKEITVLTASQTAASSEITLSPTQSEVVFDSGQAAAITVPISVTGATINISSLINDDGVNATTTLPEITLNVATDISATPIKVVIPQNTVITAPAGWNGIINALRIEANNSAAITPDSGNAAAVSAVIEVGYGDIKLTFNKAVRLLIPEAAGKYAGYSRGGTFTKITAVCGADTQAAGDSLADGGDCKVDVGADLAIWTKHFTKFAVYEQTAIPNTPVSGGGSATLAPCLEVKYDSWQNVCADGWQYRNVLSSAPLNCALTAEQENQRKKVCSALDKTKNNNSSITTDNINNDEILAQVSEVLGAKIENSLAAQLDQIAITAEANKLISGADFVASGTNSTFKLGAGERAGVLNSYKSTFDKLPETLAEWEDVVRISNNILPQKSNLLAESKAKAQFKKIYQREFNAKKLTDKNAVNMIAYGLRLAARDLDLERAGIKNFVEIYYYLPSSATDWDIVRAVAYNKP